MAIAQEVSGPDVIEPTDPYAELEFEEITPIWPDTRSIDFAKARLSYDRLSDTLYMHFFGRERPAISVEVGSDRLTLVDPETHSVVGVQLEAFLARAIHDFPPLVVALDVAELRGITPAEVRAEYKEVFSIWDRFVAKWQRRTERAKKCVVVNRYADRDPHGRLSQTFVHCA